MASRTVRPHLDDMLNAIEIVGRIVSGMDLAHYCADPISRLAVERCIEIISEASRRLPEDMKARYSQVPWPAIRAVGNRLRHDYGGTDNRVMWLTATRSLPDLTPVIQATIADLEPG